MEGWAMVSGDGPGLGMGRQWRMGSGCHQTMGNEGFAMGCCSAFMDDDPPFVGWDDADAATVVGTSCRLPGSIIQVTPLKTGENNPTIFLQF
jgi:hypothetical protein